jgi:hemolysin III
VTPEHEAIDSRIPARALTWNYSRAEVFADGAVHAIGILAGILAVAALVVLAAPAVGPWQLTSVLVYGGGLLAVLVISAAYNLWPVSRTKWILRRFDHSAIYLLIAGTYTPFAVHMKDSATSLTLLAGVWAASLSGIALKLGFPGRFDRVSVGFYLLTAWSGVMAYDMIASLPSSTVWLLSGGGILYTVGVVFHLWRTLPFQNAVWHAFVLLAATCHYGAVLDCLILTAT